MAGTASFILYGQLYCENASKIMMGRSYVHDLVQLVCNPVL